MERRKFIYTLDSRVYGDRSLHDGTWVTFDKDLLPLIHQGLARAWQRGFLKESRKVADYYLSGMNLGWEMPGTFDATVQVRNLRLDISESRPHP